MVVTTLDRRRTQAGAKIPVTVSNQGNIPLDVTGDVNVTNDVLHISTYDDLSLDAFGRFRVSNSNNRFDVEFIYDKQDDIVDEVTSGGATAVHNANSRDVILNIINANSGTAVALYGYDVPYTPGNSQLINITGTLNNAAIANGSASLFLRSTVSGATVETVYNQADWNINTVPDVNWAYSQILAMDFQSLKVGRIRFGLVRNGVSVLIHQIFNDNIRNTGFWQLPSLPVYWRIYNVDVNQVPTYTYMEMGYGDTLNAIGLRYQIPINANATMRAICASVKSEDGKSIDDLPGFNRAVSRQNTPLAVSTTLIPVLSIRPAATFQGLANHALYIPTGYSILADNPLRYRILYHPTLTNAAWVAVDATHSGMEYDVSATAVAGGVVIDEDYFATNRNSLNVLGGALGREELHLSRDGTQDILTIAAIRTSTNNASTYAALKWKEIR